MKTKLQKSKEITLGKKLLSENHSLVFIEFTGIGIEFIKKLKKELKKNSAVFRVIKKSLLGLAFKQSDIDFDPNQFNAHLGVVYAKGDLSTVASIVYKFSKDLAKEKKELRILGSYELDKKQFMNLEQFLTFAKLPSREVLLAMLVGVLVGPIRKFMYVINELSKQKSAANPSGGEAKVGT